MRVKMPPLVRRRSIQHAHDLTVPGNLQNSTSNCVGHVDKMIRCDKEAEGVTDFPFAKVPALEIENLDAPIFAVAYINLITIDCDGMRKIELPRTAAFHSPAEEHVAVFIELQHARISFAVRDVNVSVTVKGDVGRLVEVENIIAGCSHST